MSQHINYDLVRAVEKIMKGLDVDKGLGVELLGSRALAQNGISSPQLGKDMINSSLNVNVVEL